MSPPALTARVSRAASVILVTVAALLGSAASASAVVSGTSVDALFPVTGLPFDGRVATFKSTFADGPFTAIIQWGDGSEPSVGTIGPPKATRGGLFIRSVSGTHTYAQNGTYKVTVSVADATNTAQVRSNFATATDCFCVNRFPKVGRTVDIGPVSGRSFIKLPGRRGRAGAARAQPKGSGFVPLTQSREIPVGTLLDTRRGSVVTLAATGTGQELQGGRFSKGLFTLVQSRRTGRVTLRLKRPGSRACGIPTGARATRRLSRRVLSRLRSSVNGRFRTRGRHSAATVRGTEWTTTERCDGTLTRVHRGSVVVRDFRLRRSVVVRAGGKYLARAPS